MDLSAAPPQDITTASMASFTSKLGLSSTASPVIVVSAEAPTPFVVLRVCPHDQPCAFHQVPLPGDEDDEPGVGIKPGSAVMVTGLGNYIVGIDHERGGLYWWSIDLDARTAADAIGPREEVGEGKPTVLVASLRNSDRVLVRGYDENDDLDRLNVFDPDWGSPRPIDTDHPNMKVAAIGERYLVGREDIDGERERLLLVPTDPETYDRPQELIEADGFTRVELTSGDELVIATSGDGDGAETFVFDVESGALVDRFIGAAVTGNGEFEAVPGLRATSPDGSHLAFRTSSGALALRDLQNHSACLVRSSSGGDHRVAGFAADGTIYMQAELAYTESRVFAFDTRERALVALDIEAGTGHHLAAVPARLPQGGRPYAIGVSNGEYSAMQENEQPQALGIRDAVWFARDDELAGMWAAQTTEGSGSQRNLVMRRFEPTLAGRRYDFSTAADATTHPPIVNMMPDFSLASIDNGERPCMSSGTPGAWAYRCASSSSSSGFAAGPVPSSEDPGAPEMPDPEVPDYGDDEGDGDGDEADDAGDESSSTDAG
jgi:hypothetical protein